MIEIEQISTSTAGSVGSCIVKESAKMPNFPGLHGYPSHFGIDLVLSEEQITSLVHHVNFLIHSVPVDFQAPIWNLLGYIAYLKKSQEESSEYYRTVLRLDPHNIVATSDLSRCAGEQGDVEESAELECKIDTWLSGTHKDRYVANAHLDIAFFYFYAGLTTATMLHLTTALRLHNTCVVSRFYYSWFCYLSSRIGYLHPPDTSFHTSSLYFVNNNKPNVALVEYLLNIIELKSSFLPRGKTHILQDKLQTLAKNNSCPLILLLVARELYNIEEYEAAIEVVKRSLARISTAPGHFLLALSLKKLYDVELETVVLPEIVTEVDNGTAISGIQVIVETQHETKHTGSASYLPVTTIRESSVDQASVISGRSRGLSVRKSSPKEQSSDCVTEALSDIEEDSPLDPKLIDIFDHIRWACIYDPHDVTQLLLLTEILILCRKLDLAILYLHEVLRRGAGHQKEVTYLRLAACLIDQKKAEQANGFLRSYRKHEYEVSEQYLNLVVKIADLFIKLKQPLQAKEWLIIMEQNNHPSCEHFTQRLKRLIAKDKNLLDAFNMDKAGNPVNKRKSRKKLGSSGSVGS